jgi:hypothetical protein
MASSDSIDELTRKTKGLHIDKPDKDYYGLQGLKKDGVLYRACLKEQDIDKDIVSKAKPGTPDANRTVAQHIASGSKKSSRFISTTASSDVVSNWATEGQPIIKIHLSKMAGMKALDEMINLTNTEVREHFLKGATHRNWAKSSQEVLFQWCIPKKNSKGENVFELWKKPKSS